VKTLDKIGRHEIDAPATRTMPARRRIAYRQMSDSQVGEAGVNRGQRLAVEEHRGRDRRALRPAFRLTQHNEGSLGALARG
jgi:hypothetical protein